MVLMFSNTDIVSRVRISLNDLHGDFWTDRQLLDFIENAKKEYCTRVPVLFNWLPVLQIEDGKYYWDETFIKYQYGETIEKEIISPATNRSCLDKGLIDNGDGTFELVGVKPGELAETKYLSSLGIETNVNSFSSWCFEYDEENNTQKGIDSNADGFLTAYDFEEDFWGIDITDEDDYETPFGIVNSVISGRPIAWLHCQRTSYINFWEVNDILPIVFYTCYLALSAETDRKNTDIANVCLSFFENMIVSRFNRNLKSLKTIQREVYL
jgi:hypothetical protein